jgi:hypothetical protein
MLNEDKQLVCPGCGEDYLHQGNVYVYSRAEDDETVVVHAISGDLASKNLFQNKGSGNPSSRRHGMRISFTCECCGDDGYWDLLIYQHKGNTYVEWDCDD